MGVCLLLQALSIIMGCLSPSPGLSIVMGAVLRLIPLAVLFGIFPVHGGQDAVWYPAVPASIAHPHAGQHLFRTALRDCWGWAGRRCRDGVMDCGPSAEMTTD